LATEVILSEASFNRSVRTYWLLSGSILCVVTVVGILVLPFWLLLGHIFTERYLQHMSCVLTDRSLKVSRGLLVRQEKTVPLDKITDLALIEGPIMRYLDLQAVKVETAGGSSPGSLITLVGIVGARDFRDTVLRQRDLVAGGVPAAPIVAGTPSPALNDPLLVEIRDALLRIEERLPSPAPSDDSSA
jgi:putative membrane protein